MGFVSPPDRLRTQDLQVVLHLNKKLVAVILKIQRHNFSKLYELMLPLMNTEKPLFFLKNER